VLVKESEDFEMWIAVFKPGLISRVATSPSTSRSRSRIHLDAIAGNSRGEGIRLQKIYERIDAVLRPANHFNAGLAHALLDSWRGLFGGARRFPTGDVHPAVEKTARVIRDEKEPVSWKNSPPKIGLEPFPPEPFIQETKRRFAYGFRSRRRIERFLAIYAAGKAKKMLEAPWTPGSQLRPIQRL